MDTTNIAQPDDIDKEMLDFIYQNGVDFLQETLNGLKVIARRAILLLSYLVVLVGFIFSNLISAVSENYKHPDNLFLASLLVLIVYYISVAYRTFLISKPLERKVPFEEPEILLQKEKHFQEPTISSSPYHLMKFARCLQIQEDIEVNKKLLAERNQKLEDAFSRTLILPALVKWIEKISCPRSLL